MFHAHIYNVLKLPFTKFNTKIMQKVLVFEKVALTLSQKRIGQGLFPEQLKTKQYETICERTG